MSEVISGGNGGSGLGKAMGILALLLLGLVVLASLAQGLTSAVPQAAAQATATPMMHCPTTSGGRPVFLVRLSQTRFPATTQHIADARRVGKPWVLTVDRPGIDHRRYLATHNFPRVAGQQPDEYPPALAREGGAGADVRNIPAGDNQSAGASMGNQLRGQPDGTLFCIELTP